MFIVGIDIAKRSHEAIVLEDSGKVAHKAFSFKNDVSGFKRLLDILLSLSADPDHFVVGMESTGHYWLALYSALRKQGFSVCVLNPIQSNALRNLYIRQVKTDQRDCLIIADVLRFGRYQQGNVPPSELYELRELCRARSFLVDTTADLKHKVIALLDQAFPEHETLFTNIFGLTSSELLLNCSTPEEILAIDTDKLAKILETPSRKRFGRAKAEQIKETAANSFGVILEFGSAGFLIKQYMEHIRYTESQIAQLEEKIAELFSHFDTQLTTIPGIGPTLGATIFSEIGDISRFPSPAKLAAFAGIDPSVKQSGEFQSSHAHMSKRGSPYLRRAIWQAAVIAAMHDPAIRAYFEKKRSQGKSYMVAIGHVTRKMNNIIFAVLRDNKPYYSSLDS